jgi:hypothetical protein
MATKKSTGFEWRTLAREDWLVALNSDLENFSRRINKFEFEKGNRDADDRSFNMASHFFQKLMKPSGFVKMCQEHEIRFLIE